MAYMSRSLVQHGPVLSTLPLWLTPATPDTTKELQEEFLRKELAGVEQSRDLPRRSVLPTPKYAALAILGTLIYKSDKEISLNLGARKEMG